jgi:hypothetical protein
MKFTTTAGEQLGTILLAVDEENRHLPVSEFVLTTGEAKHLQFKLEEGIAKAAIALGASVTPDLHSSCVGGFCRPMGVEEAEARHDAIAQERAASSEPTSCNL